MKRIPFNSNSRKRQALRVSNNEKPVEKKGFDSDILLKLIPAIITIATIGIGIYQYNKGVEREFRKNYYEGQMQVYNDLIELCSKIAIWDADSLYTQGFSILETKLNENYHGRLSLFQNAEVEAKVSDFLISLQRFKRDDDSETVIDNDAMKYKCFLVTQACRRSLSQTYAVNLKDLQFSIEDSSVRKIASTKDLVISK